MRCASTRRRSRAGRLRKFPPEVSARRFRRKFPPEASAEVSAGRFRVHSVRFGARRLPDKVYAAVMSATATTHALVAGAHRTAPLLPRRVLLYPSAARREYYRTLSSPPAVSTLIPPLQAAAPTRSSASPT
jgi:hypothetical protein